jgi:hypothetical protein
VREGVVVVGHGSGAGAALRAALTLGEQINLSSNTEVTERGRESTDETPT